jgi:hypothetical protein
MKNLIPLELGNWLFKRQVEDDTLTQALSRCSLNGSPIYIELKIASQPVEWILESSCKVTSVCTLEKLLRIPHKPHRIGRTTIAGRGVTISMGVPIHVYISHLHWSQIQLQPPAKRLSKFASIVARVVTLPSSVPIDANDKLQLRRNATIVERYVTLLLLAPIYDHVLLFHHQQRHPITKEVLRQSKRPRHVLIMDMLVILPINALTSVNYRPQPKATTMFRGCRQLQMP